MTILEEFRKHPQRVLDRLVDGELGANERRQLLAAFDDEPGAWRQCALAFLEAQSWGWQLSRMATEPIVAQVSAGATSLDAAGALAEPVAHDGWAADVIARTRTTALWSAALAASVLIAFLLGTRVVDRHEPAPLVAESTKEKVPAGVGSQNETTPKTSDQLAAAQPAADRPIEVLTFKPYGRDEAIEVPLVPSSEQAVLAEAGKPSEISGALASQFARDGFVVELQQRLWPMELPDGRSVLVPVEEVSIQSPESEKL
jgi:hypothetical protein